MSGKKNTLYIISVSLIVLMFVFMALFVRSKNGVMLVFGVIMLNAAYQVITRLLVGTICEGVFENGIDSSAEWFKTGESEERLYSFLGIKRLKRNLPKFERTDFSLTRQSIQDIIDTGCEIEAEHEINIVVSMLGVLFAIPFGETWVFVIFAVAAVLYDLLFIAVQRFNRPRLETVQLKRRARFFEKMDREEAAKAQAEALADDADSNLVENERDKTEDGSEEDAQ